GRSRNRVAGPAMATTLGQAPPSGPPRTELGGSARAALARRENTRTRILRVVVLLVAVAVLVRGWMVTEIDLGKLSNAPNAAPILKALIQPDVAARDISPIELQEPFIVGAGSTGPATVGSPTGQTLRITPGSASPGQNVAFDGAGFEPDTD